MPDLKTIIPKPDRAFLPESRPETPEDPKQQKLMMGSLCLLLLALGIVFWHEREFWFPDVQETESVPPVESSPVASHATAAPVQPSVAVPRPDRKAKPNHHVAKHMAAFEAGNPVPPSDSEAPPGATIGPRTVLPPLEVEVVAGDSHRSLHPGTSSVRVDLQPDTPPQPVADANATDPAAADSETAANVTSNAVERVQMSANTSDIVARPVRPSYPLLARQMQVQGSVILRALIGKDGIIQDLHVVSGPHILASAAKDAVRQWHFKPHFEGSEAVETQAKIIVNFTISTN